MRYPEFKDLHLSEDRRNLRAERNSIVHKLKSDGLSNQDIGDRVFLSREQVRQILLRPPLKP